LVSFHAIRKVGQNDDRKRYQHRIKPELMIEALFGALI